MGRNNQANSCSSYCKPLVFCEARRQGHRVGSHCLGPRESRVVFLEEATWKVGQKERARVNHAMGGEEG